MSLDEILVLLGGVAALAWVNWYFFRPQRAVAAVAAAGGGIQQLVVTVRGGYTPGAVTVKRGQPVALVFDRQETSGCSEEVVLADFGIRRFLPAHRKTTVEITPEKAGSYEFTCGMGMLRGRITVED
jgi:plastocyanin domain-containing protein